MEWFSIAIQSYLTWFWLRKKIRMQNIQFDIVMDFETPLSQSCCLLWKKYNIIFILTARLLLYWMNYILSMTFLFNPTCSLQLTGLNKSNHKIIIDILFLLSMHNNCSIFLNSKRLWSDAGMDVYYNERKTPLSSLVKFFVILKTVIDSIYIIRRKCAKKIK